MYAETSGKTTDKNLSRLKYRETNHRRTSHNNVSSVPSSIFPPTVFPRFDIERLALPLDEDSVGVKPSQQWRPSTLPQGRIALSGPSLGYADGYDSIRASMKEHFFQSVISAEIHLFFVTLI